MVRQRELEITTTGRGTIDITTHLREFIESSGLDSGICHVFIPHTSASLIICENADPDVRRDLENFIADLVPDGDPRFVHTAEGPDDMPAHVRSILTQASISVPVRNRRLMLGTWQGVYLWEHRTAGHRRRVLLSVYD